MATKATPKGKKPVAAPKAAKPKKPTQSNDGREILYPLRKSVWHVADPSTVDGPAEPPLTEADADRLLGWQEEPEGANWKEGEYLLVDELNKKIRCTNNSHNRPYTDSHARGLAQDMLNRRWADSRNTRADDSEPMSVNGETIVINRYGDTDSGQHRLIGFKLACQIFKSDTAKGEHYRKLWEDVPWDNFTMECLIVYGVSGNPRVAQTLDNVRTRTPADVIYTQRDKLGLGSKIKASEIKEFCRIMEYAIRQIWARTGQGSGLLDAYRPKLTNSEVMDFIDRHPRLVREVGDVTGCVPHIWAENKDGQVRKIMGPGTAAGMLYVMACSSSEPDKYKEDPREEHLDFSRWEKATAFWVGLCAGTSEFAPVREALGALITDDGSTPSPGERMAVIINAWNEYVEGNTMTKEKLAPDIKDGVLIMPSVGGIDLGDAERVRKDTVQAVKKQASDAAKADKKKLAAEDIRKRLADIRGEGHRNHVLILKSLGKDNKSYFIAWDEDAQPVADVAGVKAGEDGSTGVPKTIVPEDKYQMVVDKLVGSGRTVTLVTPGTGDNVHEVNVVGRPVTPEPAKKAPPKPKAKVS